MICHIGIVSTSIREKYSSTRKKTPNQMKCEPNYAITIKIYCYCFVVYVSYHCELFLLYLFIRQLRRTGRKFNDRELLNIIRSTQSSYFKFKIGSACSTGEWNKSNTLFLRYYRIFAFKQYIL